MVKYADRVRETFTTTGTGTLNLLGAVTGFQTVVLGIEDGEEGYFLATDGTNWEVFRGTITDAAPDTLTRVVIKSSNADALVSWAAGTKDVFLVTPADVMDKIRGPNFIINGDFRVARRGTSFTAATTPANSDDTYLLDRCILLSDGNDIVDVTQGTDGAVGNATYLQADVETVQKKFGFLWVIENKDIHELLSESDVVSLSFNALVSDATKLSRVKAMVLSWTSTADAVTSDIVNAWGIEGTSPTVVANWTIEGDSGDLGVTAVDRRYTLANVAINAAGVENIAVFIWSDDVATNDTLGTLLKITNVKLEVGPVATKLQHRPFAEELMLCQWYFRRLIDGDNQLLFNCFAVSDIRADGFIGFPEMRAAPTRDISSVAHFEIVSNALAVTELGSLNLNNASPRSAQLTTAHASTGAAGEGRFVMSKSASATFDLVAEL